MLDRESTFADPAVIQLLQKEFIPVAIDQAYQRRQQDAEGEFYREIVDQSPRVIGPGTTQGLYTASADGVFLGFTNRRGSKHALRLLKSALIDQQTADVATIDRGIEDARYNPQPPEGGCVVRVTSKVLGGYGAAKNKWQEILQNSIGRDNLWIRADEYDLLVQGKFADSLLTRISRFHLVDNTRGEPPMWKKQEIRKLEYKFQSGRLRASIDLTSDDGDRSYEAELLGFVDVTGDQLTRFEIVVKGRFRGHGRYTPNPPKGSFPFAVVFTLANGDDVADDIPPQGSRGWVKGYLEQ